MSVRRSEVRKGTARPWYSTLGYVLATLLGLIGVVVALYNLVTPTAPLQIETVRIGTIPATVFTLRDGAAQHRGPAVVIAHGFAGSQQLMYPFAVTLARNGYTAVTFDFPGHGQNSTPLQGSISDRDQRYAQLSAALDQVVAFARQRSDGRVGLIGHSMGSEAVVRYAQANPDIAATVAVSLGYDGVTPSSPRNLLVVTGALEGGLRPVALAIADAVADGGTGAADITYGDIDAGTARRIVFAPGVEHIGVLYSPQSMDETLRWFNATFKRTATGPVVLDERAPWMGLLYLAVTLLFFPFALLLQRIGPQTAPVAPILLRGGNWTWWALAIIPTLTTPVILRFVPTEGLLPILVGGPLALHFALYGISTAIGLLLTRQWRRTEKPPADDPRSGWLAIFRRRFLIYTAMALLAIGYVFLTFGVPAQLFLLNYFPPLERLPIFAAVLLAMLPYFLADEWLTRRSQHPRGAYAITKAAFMVSLFLAILLNQRLFFLVLIAPLFVAYFVIYGLFSGQIYRRTGTAMIGAVANSVIFAWSVAAVFPLVGPGIAPG